MKMISEDKQNEFALGTMWKDFYNRNMLSVIILTWFWFIIVLAVGIFSGIKFYHAVDVKEMILYAMILLTCVQMVVLLKLFAYGVIHRNAINRRIDKLEQRVAGVKE